MRRLGATLNAIVVTAVLLPAPPAQAWQDRPDVVRLAGHDRYATAATVSETVFPDGSEAAFVATGEDYADALAAAAAADGRAPVLLTGARQLPAVTSGELRRLSPERIFVIGGPAAVSDAVLAQLAQLAPEGAVRIAGDSRYATAALVSQEFFPPGVNVVRVATGEDFPDALAATSGPGSGPVLLVARDWVPDATAAELQRLRPWRVQVLGGASAIAPQVDQRLRELTDAPVARVAGPSRYDTAARWSEVAWFDTRTVAAVTVATGEAFADALAGAPAASRLRGPVLLTRPGSLPDATRCELARLRPATVAIIGGSAAVSIEVERQLGERPDPEGCPDPSPELIERSCTPAPLPRLAPPPDGPPTVAHTVQLPTEFPGQVLVDADGRRAYVAAHQRDEVLVVDLQHGVLLDPIPVGRWPTGIDFLDDRTLLVANHVDGDLSLVDLDAGAEVRRLPLQLEPRDGPRSVAVACNGLALVSSTVVHGSGFGGRLHELEIDTGVLRQRRDFLLGQSFQSARLRTSDDQTAVLVTLPADGVVARYDARANAFAHAEQHDAVAADLNRTGSRIVLGIRETVVLDASLRVTARFEDGSMSHALVHDDVAYRSVRNTVELVGLDPPESRGSTELSPEPYAGHRLAISTDGSTLVAVRDDRLLVLTHGTG